MEFRHLLNGFCKRLNIPFKYRFNISSCYILLQMKKQIFTILTIVSFSCITEAQTINRISVSSSGGTLNGSNGSINYNIGETVIASLSAVGNLLTQGFEQPSESSLSLKLFLQGYYINGGSMQPVLINQGIASGANETDTLEISLHDPETFTKLESIKTLLLTDGSVLANFTQPEGSYYISVKHRNSIQTWSANPVECTASTVLYDFSASVSMAMGDNQAMVEAGVFAFYTGDINQDDFIDGNDFPAFDTDSFNGVAFEYVATDLNGDGFVDGNDFPVFDNNSFNGITSIHP